VGIDFGAYEIVLGETTLELVTRSLPDGKIELYVIVST
jgi:hypothetical protein